MRYREMLGLCFALTACAGISSIGGGNPPDGSGGTLSGSAGTPAGLAGTGTVGIAGYPTTLDPSVVGCDYETTLTKSCAMTGCHRGPVAVPPIAGLDLLPDSNLVWRLKDVPAQFTNIQCSAPDEPYFECVPSECPTGATLVTSADWESSWFIRKLRGTQGNCGEEAYIGGSGPTDHLKEKDCLERLVQAIAALPE